jgi:hypothetical protein
MQSLEQIVRPFQSPAVLAKRRVVSTSIKIDVDEVIVEWGRSGDLPAPIKREVIDDEGFAFTVVKCDDNYQEKNRAFNVVRIENPDDPSQYVMVERINQIKFNKENENEQQVYNNESTSFVTLPAFDNTTYYASNYGQEQCHATYNLTYPTG